MAPRETYLIAVLVALGACLPTSAQQPQNPGKGGIDKYGDPLPPGAIARFGTERLYQPAVRHMVFAPDGKTLAATSRAPFDNVVRLWDVATGKQIRQWRVVLVRRGRPGENPIAFSPDGRYLAVGASDEHTHVFEVETGKEVMSVSVGMFVRHTVFAHDGRSLATWSSSGIRVHEVSERKAPV